MARNDNSNSTSGRQDGRRTAASRDRRRDKVITTVKERPYATAALATVAAGAAAFILTRGKSDKPLMNWARTSDGDNIKGAGAFKGDTSAVGATSETTSPSAAQAAKLSSQDAATGASSASKSSPAANGKASSSELKNGGLDETSATETKVGAIAYGA